MSVNVTIRVEKCLECPYCFRERTPYADYAFDFFCGSFQIDFERYRPIALYVEYNNEFPKEIPEWCPYRK